MGKTKTTRHWQNCEAPICRDDIEPELLEERIWIVGEGVCKKQPYATWQRQQIKMNSLFLVGKLRDDFISSFRIIDLPSFSTRLAKRRGAV